MFVRSQLEKSVAVWHSGFTNLNKEVIERVQVSSMKAIFKKQYINYKEALKIANLTTLEVRREKMCKDRKISKIINSISSKTSEHTVNIHNKFNFNRVS